MVAHQAIGVDHPVESINRFGQHLQKQRPVGVVPIDILPPVTTRSDVIKAVREFEAEWARHGGGISKTGRVGKKKGLAPACAFISQNRGHLPAHPELTPQQDFVQ